MEYERVEKIYPSPKIEKQKEPKFNLKQKGTLDIMYFYDTINNLKVNTEYFKKNIRTLRIDIETDYLDEGAYYSEFNIIKIKSGHYKEALDHELLHMATSAIQNNRDFCGFSQADLTKENAMIGTGLNEGYTALLDYRYFNLFPEDVIENKKMAYEDLQIYVKLLEDIVGRESMERWYFKSDLKSLFQLLSIYMGKEKTFQFLEAIDTIYENVYNYNDIDYDVQDIIMNSHMFIINYIATFDYIVQTEAYETKLINRHTYKLFLKTMKEYEDYVTFDENYEAVSTKIDLDEMQQNYERRKRKLKKASRRK